MLIRIFVGQLLKSDLNIPRFAFDPGDLAVLLLIAISTIVDLAISIYYLSQGTSIVFQNIYYFTIVLAAYWFRWRGALFSCVLSVAYLALSTYYDQEFVTVMQAIIRTVIFVLIALVVAYLSSRLEDEKRRYQAIFSASGSGMVVVIRNDHIIQEANNRFLQITTEESVAGRDIENYFAKDDLLKLEELLQNNATAIDLEMDLMPRSGEKRACLVSGSNLSSKELVISVIDITERKKALRTIEESNKKLNILSSITRHDTTNKLIILSGHLALHSETIADEKEKKRVEIMSEVVDSLSENLDFADHYRRIGINSPEWQSVQKAGESAAAQFDSPGVTITVDSSDLEVLADPMLKKVFYNLIDNSLKHGGKITEIRISSIIGEKDARIIYQDNGVGIPDEKKERIFEDGYGRDHGLGLFLIREILKITNIEIKEIGTQGRGARFEIVVPIGSYRTRLDTE